MNLRPHQQALLLALLNPSQPHPHRRLFVAPTGSGKTITAIVAGVCLLVRGVVNAVHIVAPKSVVPQFRGEVNRLVPAQWRRAFTVTTHTVYFRKAASVRRTTTRRTEVVPRVFLIIDEAHALATRVHEHQRKSKVVRTRSRRTTSRLVQPTLKSGARAYYAIAAAQHATALLLLTATPLQNSPNDLINLLCMLRAESYQAFYNEPMVSMIRAHIAKQQRSYLRTGNHDALIQSNATQLMRTYVREMSPLFVFAQVNRGDDYPNETHKVKRLTMDSAYLQLYNAIERDHVNEFRIRLEEHDRIAKQQQQQQQQKKPRTARKRRISSKGLDSPLQCVFQPDNINAFYLKLRHVVNGCTEFVVSAKVRYAVDIVLQAHHKVRCAAAKTSATHTTHNVIVYSNFIDGGLTLIAKQLHKHNVPYVDIIGERTLHARKAFAAQFNDPAHPTHVMLLSKAGCEGLDLKGVRDVVLLEPHFHTERIKQVIGRAVRFRSHSHLPPKERHVTIHHLLLCKPNDDGDTWEAIERHNEQQIHSILRKYAQRAKIRTLKLQMHAANRLLFTEVSNEYWSLHGSDQQKNPFRTVPIETDNVADNDQSIYIYFTDGVQLTSPLGWNSWDALDDDTSESDRTVSGTPAKTAKRHYDAVYVLKHPPKRASVDVILYQMAERKARLNATHLQLFSHLKKRVTSVSP